MEKQSNIAWVLAGIRPKNTDGPLTEGSVVETPKIEDAVLRTMLEEAFLPGRTFTLFLCGAFVDDKVGTLEEMELGYKMIRNGMEEYEFGDYGIVSFHEEGNLLFMPIEDLENLEEDAQNISGNTDNLQG